MSSPNDQGHGPQHFEVIINGRPKQVTQERLSYDDIVVLAFATPKEDVAYTVTYKHGPKENSEGTLAKGESVLIKGGMMFNVTATNRS